MQATDIIVDPQIVRTYTSWRIVFQIRSFATRIKFEKWAFVIPLRSAACEESSLG